MASLTFMYSSMNAGKSLELIKIFHNFVEKDKDGTIVNSENIICLTSGIDNRNGVGKITSRPLEKSLEAVPVSSDDDIVELVDSLINSSRKKIDVVLVDEAQFFSEEQIMQMCWIVDNLGINVICFGLRTNFRGELFEGSQALLSFADKIREIKNKCGVCGCTKKAIMNARINSNGKIVRDGEEIEIGDSNYLSVCRSHFLVGF